MRVVGWSASQPTTLFQDGGWSTALLKPGIIAVERLSEQMRFFAVWFPVKCSFGMSEKVEQPSVVSVVALRAEGYSADGDDIVISLRTKYSTAERKYSIPVECFRDLIVDLRRLSLSAPIAPAHTADTEAEPPLPLEPPVAAE